MTTIAIGRAAQVAAGIKQTLGNRIAEEGVVVFIGAQFDVAKGLIEGKTVEQSMTGAAVNATGNMVLGQLLATRKMKGLIEKIPLPTQLKITSGNANMLKEKIIDKLADRQITGRAASLAEEAMAPDKRRLVATNGAEQRGGVYLPGEISAADEDALDHAVRRLN
jgi:hypothetical protein